MVYSSSESVPDGVEVVEESETDISYGGENDEIYQEENDQSVDEYIPLNSDEYLVHFIQSRIHAPDYNAVNITHISQYNKFVKDASAELNDARARIHYIENKNLNYDKDFVYLKNQVRGLPGVIQQNIDWVNSRIDSTNKFFDELNARVSSNVARIDARIDSTNVFFNSLNGTVSKLSSDTAKNIEWLGKRIDSTNAYLDQHSGDISGLKKNIEWVNSRIDSTNSYVNQHSSDITGLKKNIEWANTRIDSTNAFVTKNTDSIVRVAVNLADNVNWLNARIDSTNKYVDQHSSDITGLKKNIEWVNTRIDSTNTFVDKAKADITRIDKSLVDNVTWLNARIDSTNTFVDKTKVDVTNLTNKVTSNDKTVNKRIDDIDLKLTSIGDWIDTGIFISINENIKTLYIRLTSIDVYSVRNWTYFKNWNDVVFPDFRKLLDDNFKSINELLTSLNTNVKNADTSNQKMMDMLFGESTDGTDGGSFSKMVYKRIYALHYSMIEHFIELQDDYLQVMKMDLATITSGVNTSNGFLSTVVSLLNSILSKPPANINVVLPAPVPLDFEKLGETIRDAIGEAFNVTNEAGTNFWDVLKEAIKSGFQLLGDALDNMVEALGKILDFIDSLLDKIIGLIVPENSDFITEGFDNIGSKFNKKFEVVLDLSGQFTTLFNPIHSDVFEILSFEFMGQKADANQAKQFIDPWASKIRDLLKIFIWVAMVIWIHRKVTGRGDLINDN